MGRYDCLYLDVKNCATDSGGFEIITIIVVAFVTGHVLHGFNSLGPFQFFQYIRLIKSHKKIESFERNKIFIFFSDYVKAKMARHDNFDTNIIGFHDLRSIAMSISNEAGELGRRFMNLHLLNSGTGFALIIIGFDFGIFFPELLLSNTYPWFHYLESIFIICTGIVLLKRGDDFFCRAMLVPFTVAATDVLLKEGTSETD